MPGMDIRLIQPSIDALNAEIARLTAARDTLAALGGQAKTTASPQKKKPTNSARSEAQRKRWAEAKRKQRQKEKSKS